MNNLTVASVRLPDKECMHLAYLIRLWQVQCKVPAACGTTAG